MDNIQDFKSYTPTLADEVFIADNARIIGQVALSSQVSVWFGAVIRGDADTIDIGAGTNIQDNAVIHVDAGFPVKIGNNCIIGHSAIVHGATLEHNVLIGMGAVVMNGAQIGAYSVIGVNALVTANTIIPPNSMVLGSPGKIKGVIDEKRMRDIDDNARLYIERAKDYLKFNR
jgi:carbonic anhydrase/acetyltransferase-like protein (isoleucine patch superfamily)